MRAAWLLAASYWLSINHVGMGLVHVALPRRTFDGRSISASAGDGIEPNARMDRSRLEIAPMPRASFRMSTCHPSEKLHHRESPRLSSPYDTSIEIGEILLDQHRDRSATRAKRMPPPPQPQAPGSPLVDARQLPPEEVRRRWPTTNFDVPANTEQALKVFFEQPTPRVICLGFAALVLARMSCGVPLGVEDAIAVPAVALGWTVQEWFLHKYVLHGLLDSPGREIHQSHHSTPFYHVCVDPPDLVIAWTLAAGLVFRLLFPVPLTLTVLGVYVAMGGFYEWTHYIVHTRVVPRSRFWKAVKRHHTLHHLKDDSCWLAFTLPQIDHLFGTVPRAPGEASVKGSSTSTRGEDER